MTAHRIGTVSNLCQLVSMMASSGCSKLQSSSGLDTVECYHVPSSIMGSELRAILV